jgi:ABC-2 type transport system permease protein
MRLVRSNLRRLVRRPATLVTYLLLVGLVLLIFLAVIVAAQQAVDPQSALASRLILTFPDAWVLTLTMVVGIGGLLAVTYGAAIAGSEWAWGTLKASIARGERRAWYALMGIAGAVLMAWLGTLIAYGAGIGAALVGANMVKTTGDTLIDGARLGQLALLLGRAGLAIAMDVAIGFTIATIARSQLAGIGAGIGLYLGEGIIGIFVPGIIKWAPFAAVSAMMSGGEGALGATTTGSLSRLDPGTATLVATAWLVVACAVAALWTERAEISG